MILVLSLWLTLMGGLAVWSAGLKHASPSPTFLCCGLMSNVTLWTLSPDQLLNSPLSSRCRTNWRENICSQKKFNTQKWCNISNESMMCHRFQRIFLYSLRDAILRYDLKHHTVKSASFFVFLLLLFSVFCGKPVPWKYDTFPTIVNCGKWDLVFS